MFPICSCVTALDLAHIYVSLCLSLSLAFSLERISTYTLLKLICEWLFSYLYTYNVSTRQYFLKGRKEISCVSITYARQFILSRYLHFLNWGICCLFWAYKRSFCLLVCVFVIWRSLFIYVPNRENSSTGATRTITRSFCNILLMEASMALAKPQWEALRIWAIYGVGREINNKLWRCGISV